MQIEKNIYVQSNLIRYIIKRSAHYLISLQKIKNRHKLYSVLDLLLLIHLHVPFSNTQSCAEYSYVVLNIHMHRIL